MQIDEYYSARTVRSGRFLKISKKKYNASLGKAIENILRKYPHSDEKVCSVVRTLKSANI